MTVVIGGKEFSKEDVYELACDLDHSILTDDGKEINNPTPTKEILETDHIPLRDRLLRVLRQGDPVKTAMINAMAEPPNLDDEADFKDPADPEPNMDPYTVVTPEPEMITEVNDDAGSKTQSDNKTSTDIVEDSTKADGSDGN